MSPETPRPCGQSRHVPLASGMVELYDSHLGKCTNTYIMHSFWFLGISTVAFYLLSTNQPNRNPQKIAMFVSILAEPWSNFGQKEMMISYKPTLQFSRYLKLCFFHCHVSFLEGMNLFVQVLWHKRSINSLDPGRSSQSSLQSRLSRREALRPAEMFLYNPSTKEWDRIPTDP